MVRTARKEGGWISTSHLDVSPHVTARLWSYLHCSIAFIYTYLSSSGKIAVNNCGNIRSRHPVRTLTSPNFLVISLSSLTKCPFIFQMCAMENLNLFDIFLEKQLLEAHDGKHD